MSPYQAVAKEGAKRHGSARKVSPRLLPRDLALIALFAALIAVSGFVAIPIAGAAVPIVLQNLAVFLAGAVLGPKRGSLAVITFLALVAAGLPLLSGGRGGIGVFASASLGYLGGWVLAAAAIGLIVERVQTRPNPFWLVLAAVTGAGVLLINLAGALVSPLFTGIELTTTLVGSLVFLPGDMVKAVLAALIASGIHRAYPVPAAGLSRGEQQR